MLKLHYEAKDFDDAYGKRTLGKLIRSLDPGKLYFLQEDVDAFHERFGERLDDMIRDGDCSTINQLLQAYGERFAERQPVVFSWLEAEHDFSVDEYYDVDRKKREFARTEEELNERWRKHVKLQLLRLKKVYGELEEAQEKLRKRFELNEKHLKEMDRVEVAAIFLNAFAQSLDPHSSYLSPAALEDFRIATGLSLEGIGATLRSEYGMTTVQSLVPGGPAKRGGQLKEKDKIIAVAQGKEEPVDVIDMKLQDVVRYIRGKRGTEVRLTVEREEKDKTVHRVVRIVREKIKLKDREAKGFLYPVEVEGSEEEAGQAYQIGLIRLPSFYMDFSARKKKQKDFKSSSRDTRRLVKELEDKGMDGLVIDLRSNGGGSLEEAVNIAGLFFDKGPVVQVRDQKGKVKVLADRDGKTYYDGPLVLLINRHSASASEILAGAIQDYGRGLVVGDTHTFGKGTVQQLREQKGGKWGAVKTTISQFFRPDGASTQLRGVEADIVIPDIMDEFKIGEKFYDYHLPWQEIEHTSLMHFGEVDRYLDALGTSSQERIVADKDFKKLLEDIEEYRAKEDERTRVSLKEEDDDEEETNLSQEEEEAASTDEELESPEEEAGEERPSLEKDITLREVLAIATDYIRLHNHRPLAKASFPELKESESLSEEKGDASKAILAN